MDKTFQMGDDTKKYTIDDALSAMGFGKYQILVLSYAGMGLISEAMEMMLLSFVGPAVQANWSLSSNAESMITSVVFVGMLIGAYSWGVVSDKFGRRKGFLITALVTSGAGFFSALAPNYAVLVICRFFVGLGLGGGPVLSSWFLEFVPAPSRGTWVSVSSAFWTVGTVLEASLAWIVMPLTLKRRSPSPTGPPLSGPTPRGGVKRGTQLALQEGSTHEDSKSGGKGAQPDSNL